MCMDIYTFTDMCIYMHISFMPHVYECMYARTNMCVGTHLLYMCLSRTCYILCVYMFLYGVYSHIFGILCLCLFVLMIPYCLCICISLYFFFLLFPAFLCWVSFDWGQSKCGGGWSYMYMCSPICICVVIHAWTTVRSTVYTHTYMPHHVWCIYK